MVRSPSVDKNGVKRGAWSEEEDNKLRAYVQRYGHWNWRQLPKFAGLTRCGKSCRLRWMNYLRPGLKKGSYTKEEEEKIIKLRQELGNKWSTIALKLPGRTDNEIKNYWNSHLKKRMHQDPISTEKNEGRFQNMHVMDQKEQDSFSMSVSESADQKMESDHADIAAGDVCTEEISSSSYNYSTLLGDVENGFSSEESFPKFFESFWTEPFFQSASNSQISSPTSYSSRVLDPEDWVTENGNISLEELFSKSFQNLSTEPVFSNATDGVISPSTSCYSSKVTNSEESSADAFCSLWTEPVLSNPSNDLISPSTSCNSTVNNWTEPVISNSSNDQISPSTSYNATFSNAEEASADEFGGFWTDSFSLDTSYNQGIHQLPPLEQGVMSPFTSFLEYDVDLFNQF